MLGHSGINTCGDGLLELSLKQEKEWLINQAKSTWLTSWSVTNNNFTINITQKSKVILIEITPEMIKNSK
jgi:hypothetical protein